MVKMLSYGHRRDSDTRYRQVDGETRCTDEILMLNIKRSWGMSVPDTFNSQKVTRVMFHHGMKRWYVPSFKFLALICVSG